jgi:hypothetical protein
MTRLRPLLAAWLLVLVGAGGTAALIDSPSGIDLRLRLEWELGRTPEGRPEIRGYIYNSYMRAANNVRLLVETLDGDGQVVHSTYGFVFGIVPVFSRSPFNVPLSATGARYRISVTSFDWRDGG